MMETFIFFWVLLMVLLFIQDGRKRDRRNAALIELIDCSIRLGHWYGREGHTEQEAVDEAAKVRAEIMAAKKRSK